MLGQTISWRGFNGEAEMTESDKLQRAGEQARAMLHAGDPFLSSPDEDGDPTGGCYNMDYPDSWHDEQNEKLASNPNYANEVVSSLRALNP